MLGVMPADAAGLAAPASRRAAWLALFSPPWTPDSADFTRIFPQSEWPTPAGMEVDPRTLVARVLAFDERTFVAATRMIADDPSLDVVMIHLGGFDNICHALWPYRFPEDFHDRPNAADVAVLGPVVDRYLEFIDERLAALVAAFPANPNVVVVSDHGEGPREHGAPWRGIHATPGMFVAAGPDVPPGRTIAHVWYARHHAHAARSGIARAAPGHARRVARRADETVRPEPSEAVSVRGHVVHGVRQEAVPNADARMDECRGRRAR